MSILRYFGSATDTLTETGSAAFTAPALRAAASVSPPELFRTMYFTQEEITGIRNNLIGYGLRAVVDAEGKILGDLVVNKGMFVVDGAGRTRKLTVDDRITAAQLTTLSQDATRRFTLDVRSDNWKEQIKHHLSETQAQAVRVTMPMAAAVRILYPNVPASRVDAMFGAGAQTDREMFKDARKVTLVGFHAPNSNFPLPQGLHLRGVAQRRDNVFVGGTPLSIEGRLQLETQPIDDCRLIEKLKAPNAPIASFDRLFVELDC